MSVASRFCLNMAANVSLQYAAELLPTPVRTQGVSLIHIVGILAHAIAPYIIDTVSISELYIINNLKWFVYHLSFH